jgi:hypothetical protein
MMGIPPREDLAAQQANGANDAYCSRVQYGGKHIGLCVSITQAKIYHPWVYAHFAKTCQKIQLEQRTHD